MSFSLATDTATTTVVSGTGDIVFALAMLSIPAWILLFGFMFSGFHWLRDS